MIRIREVEHCRLSARDTSRQLLVAVVAGAELFHALIVMGQERRFSTGGGRAMSDTYIIEVSSKAAGIVVRDKSGYRFFAASHDFNSLEGRYFRSAREAERAAAQFKLERDTRAAETT
jgi:hypothetical protein